MFAAASMASQPNHTWVIGTGWVNRPDGTTSGCQLKLFCCERIAWMNGLSLTVVHLLCLGDVWAAVVVTYWCGRLH